MDDLPQHNEGLQKRLDALISISLNPIKIQELNLKEKIAFLDSFAFDYREIAAILHTTPNVVAKEKSLLKRAIK